MCLLLTLLDFTVFGFFTAKLNFDVADITCKRATCHFFSYFYSSSMCKVNAYLA